MKWLGVPGSILSKIQKDKVLYKLTVHLLIVEVLEAALYRHVIVLGVGKSLFDAELEGLASDTKLVDIIVFVLLLLNQFCIIVLGRLFKFFFTNLTYPHACKLQFGIVHLSLKVFFFLCFQCFLKPCLHNSVVSKNIQIKI